MMLAFVLSAGVQYNDPDPIRWMLVYAVALILCVAWHKDRLTWSWFAAAAVVSVVAALAVASTVPPGADVFVAVGDWHMHQMGSEPIRESGGLVFVAVWMAILARWRRTQEKLGLLSKGHGN